MVERNEKTKHALDKLEADIAAFRKAFENLAKAAESFGAQLRKFKKAQKTPPVSFREYVRRLKRK